MEARQYANLRRLKLGQLRLGGFADFAAALGGLLKVGCCSGALAFTQGDFAQIVRGQLGGQELLAGDQVFFRLGGIA